MPESLRCPNCSTRYVLRPHRVQVGIRRARCLRCDGTFDIEDAVTRLLAPPPVPTAQDPFLNMESLPELELDLLESDPPAPVEPPFEALPAMEPAEVSEEDVALSLGDLDGADEEILEKTLVIEPEPAGSAPHEEDGAAPFSSAKDAISKLLGAAPPPPPPDRRISRSGNTMDVEATLDALESTLGGVAKESLAPAPEPGPSAALMGGSTVKLSPAEIQAAMSAGASGLAGASEPVEAPKPMDADTVGLPKSVTAQAIEPRPAAPPVASADAAASDPNTLLKIQVGQETYNNVSLEQAVSWIEQGRLADWHMVARQFSEHWIEAGKVPSLRPIFERLRRAAAPAPLGAPPAFPIANETAPIKRGLFGGLFKG